jgi:hypothetical protein
VSISSNLSSLTSTIWLNYDIDLNYDTGRQILNNKISQVQKDVKKFTIDWVCHDVQIGGYIDALRISCKTLKRFKMVDGFLYGYGQHARNKGSWSAREEIKI